MITRSGWNRKLAERGVGEIVGIGQASEVLGISARSMRDNITRGRLNQVDRAVVSREDLAKWLARYPRYAAKMAVMAVVA